MFNLSSRPRLLLRMIFFPLTCTVCIFSHEGHVVADLVMSTELIIILSCFWFMFWRSDAGLMLAKHRLYRLSHPHLHAFGSGLASASLAHWVLALEKSLVGLVAFPVETLNRCFVLFVFSGFKDSPLALTSASGCLYRAVRSPVWWICQYPALLPGHFQNHGLLVFIKPCEFEVVLWLLPMPHLHNFILCLCLSLSGTKIKSVKGKSFLPDLLAVVCIFMSMYFHSRCLLLRYLPLHFTLILSPLLLNWPTKVLVFINFYFLKLVQLYWVFKKCVHVCVCVYVSVCRSGVRADSSAVT